MILSKLVKGLIDLLNHAGRFRGSSRLAVSLSGNSR